MIPLSLTWSRCLDGLEVVERPVEPPIKIPEGATPRLPIKKLFEPPEWRLASDGSLKPNLFIQPRTDRRQTVHLNTVDLENPVALRYINAKSESELTKFFDRYGFLLQREHHDGSPKEDTELAFEMWSHKLISGALQAAFGKNPAEKAEKVHYLVKSDPLRTSFELGPDGKGQLVFHPANLRHFMCFEIAMAAASDVALTNCGTCGNAFFVGRPAHRRTDAKFCSERCRVAAMRKRNAEAARPSAAAPD